MNMNSIVLVTVLCFTIGLIIHIVVEREKTRKHLEKIKKDKQKRVRETLKKLDWKQRV